MDTDCVVNFCSLGMEDFFAPLVAQACLQVKAPGANTFNVDNVRVNKIVGGNFEMSTLVNGMVIPRDALGVFTRHHAHCTRSGVTVPMQVPLRR